MRRGFKGPNSITSAEFRERMKYARSWLGVAGHKIERGTKPFIRSIGDFECYLAAPDAGWELPVEWVMLSDI